MWSRKKKVIKGVCGEEVQFSSVAQSCLTLGNPMDCSTPDFPVHHQLRSLLKLMSIKSVMPFNHVILCPPFSSNHESFSASGAFPVSQFFSSSGQSIGASASASVLPMNIQDWFPLGWTFDLLAVQGTLKSLLQHHSSKTSIDVEGLKWQHKVHSEGLLIPGPTGFSLYGALVQAELRSIPPTA